MNNFLKNQLKANITDRVAHLFGAFMLEEMNKIETEGGKKAFVSLLDTEPQLVTQMNERFMKERMSEELMDKIAEEEMQKLLVIFASY